MGTRYFIYISYRGTSYHGWQIQPGSLTVQQKLENGLSVILREKISVTGAGRTDTGVHALVFCAHFDSLESDLDSDIKLLYKLNSYLPADISVNSIKKVVPDANARYSALSRTYKYFISSVKDPFSENTSWHLNCNIDIERMNQACRKLKDYSDFTSFSKLHSGAKTNICKIFYAEWDKKDKQIIFTIRADRFLRNMVRAIVGTMVDLGTGKIDIIQFENIVQAKDRCRAGTSAPAGGLFLIDIEYPDEIFI